MFRFDRSNLDSHIRFLTLSAFAALLSIGLFAQEPVKLPSRRVKELTYITCSIGNSGPLNCLLDTGSAMTGVSRATADRLKLKTHVDAAVPRPDIANQALDELTLHAGSATWVAARTSIAPSDLAALDGESGPGFLTDVVLGTSLLEHFQLTVDPDADVVSLARSGTEPPLGAEKLLTATQLVPFAILSIMTADGHPALGPFSLDTGSRPALLLSKAFWSTRPALAQSESKDSQKDRTTLTAIRLGHQTMRQVPALIPVHEAGLVASKNIGGVIGAALLNRFVVTYDLPLGAVWITPAKANASQ